MPRAIVLNTSYGGFRLSDRVKQLYLEATRGTPRPEHWYIHTDVARDDPDLIRIIRAVGLDKACDSEGGFTKLKIVEIPDDVLEWEIMDYDGIEWVAETHRRWS